MNIFKTEHTEFSAFKRVSTVDVLRQGLTWGSSISCYAVFFIASCLSRQNPFGKKDFFYNCKIVSILQKGFYIVQIISLCFCRTRQLIPAFYSWYLSKIELYGFAEWLALLLRIICKSFSYFLPGRDV